MHRKTPWMIEKKMWILQQTIHTSVNSDNICRHEIFSCMCEVLLDNNGNGIILWFSWFITHWCWVMHICIGKLTIIASDGQHQAIIWTNADMLLTGLLETNFNETLIKNLYILIKENAFQNVIWKMAAILPRPLWGLVIPYGNIDHWLW